MLLIVFEKKKQTDIGFKIQYQDGNNRDHYLRPQIFI